MPVYLVHGFRWPRDGFTGIRVHTIVHNLEDCSVEYIQNPNSRSDLLRSFRKAYPEIMKELEGSTRTITFVEQYDPEDESGENVVSSPYAYVADKVVMIAGGPNAESHLAELVRPETPESSSSHGPPPNMAVTQKRKPSGDKSQSSNSPNSAMRLSMNIDEVLAAGPGLTTQAWTALADLRDKIAEGQKIGWWVVYNGDPERAYDTSDEEVGYEEDLDEEEQAPVPISKGPAPVHQLQIKPPPPVPPQQPSPRVYDKPQPSKVEASPRSSSLPNREKPQPAPPKMSPVNEQKEDIPKPPKLKDVAKSKGIRKKLFGRK